MDIRPLPLRIVICPWLAFGHLLPYMELAERLAARGHRVTFVSTPRNLARLPSLCNVDLVELPLPRIDGLPEGAESTNDVPDEKRELHWQAFDGLGAPFSEFLTAACAEDASRPHWIIADCFHHWAAAAALHHKVPCAVLLPTAAMLAAAPRQQATDPGPAAEAAASVLGQAAAAVRLAVPRYEQDEVAPAYADDCASGMSIAERWFLAKEKCTVMAIRSCVEWEPETFPLMETILGKPVVPLGLLAPSADGGRRRGAGSSEDDATLRWLDSQPPDSVVYVALGSEVPLSVEQVHELALGLELAGTCFLWALRKPAGADAVLDNAADTLPPGFQDRIHGHGVVTTGWVPQLSILAHTAVGGFLTHCGRNSLIEGLLFGHPLVMLPISGDQGPNARQMEGKKVGLQVARDDDDGSFDRHGVAAAVRAVMLDGESRRGFIANALKMQEIVADKDRHERYIDKFVKQLRLYLTPLQATGDLTTATPNSN